MLEVKRRVHSLFVDGELRETRLCYHSPPKDAAEVANQAGVKRLAMSHPAPSSTNLLELWAFLRGVSAVRRKAVALGYDGMLIELSIGLKEV